jgi:hypothetical protein
MAVHLDGLTNEMIAIAKHALEVRESCEQFFTVEQCARPQIPAVQIEQVEHVVEQP